MAVARVVEPLDSLLNRLDTDRHGVLFKYLIGLVAHDKDNVECGKAEDLLEQEVENAVLELMEFVGILLFAVEDKADVAFLENTEEAS